MAPRKRKSPEKRPVRRQPGLLSQAASATGVAVAHAAIAAGGMIARYPSTLGGAVVFTVVFGFVSANALWYQPGDHPRPLFRTRDAADPDGLAGFRNPANAPADNVTTFRIQRADAAEPATEIREATPAAPQSALAEPQAQAAASASAASASAAAAAMPSSPLVMSVQNELIRRGLYNGPADGRAGPRTAAAILFFEETEGLPQTGEATPAVLAALKGGTKNAASASLSPTKKTVPLDRPAENVKAALDDDPVAAAIRSAGGGSVTGSVTPPRESIPPPALVMKIQRGLANLAYADVSIDGVAGMQTKAAIRHFEKHYRLPETGEPNELVLKKLKSIGAL